MRHELGPNGLRSGLGRNESPTEIPKRSGRRGIRFLIGGVLGGTVVVVIFSAAFRDWVHLTRWASGLVAVGLAIGYLSGRLWLMRRTARFVKFLIGARLPQRQGEARCGEVARPT